MTAAGVALLEPEELDLGLDSVEEVESHDGGLCGSVVEARAYVLFLIGRDFVCSQSS